MYKIVYETGCIEVREFMPCKYRNTMPECRECPGLATRDKYEFVICPYHSMKPLRIEEVK